MPLFRFVQNLFLKSRAEKQNASILSIEAQINNWRLADRKMGWNIGSDAFDRLEKSSMPSLTDNDRRHGFIGSALFYGFGDDGRGNADVVLSGKLAWEYAAKHRKKNIWQCEYINFSRTEDIRLRPDAPARPKGFYYAMIQSGEQFKSKTVSEVRKTLTSNTGWGPEGFQFLCITHPHFATLMNARKIAFMALADYDVAPYGYNDFFDAPQLFCSNHKLGLGIGNVDRNYPLFGIPILRFVGGQQPADS